MIGQIAFYVLAVTAFVSGLGVITFRNAVYSALSLILNFFSLALFYLMLNAIFIAAAQVLIYAGAIMVLFLFVVTMLSPDTATLATEDRLWWQRFAGTGLGIILAGAVAYILLSSVSLQSDAVAKGGNDLSTQITQHGNTEAFGLALFHGYLFPFELTSVILLVAILGAVVLGRRVHSKEEK